MKTEHENQKSKLCLKRVSNPNDEQGPHSLDKIREVGSYTWIAESITEEMGFPSCVKDTDDCLFCEGQLFVMRHGAEETNQSTDSFGQVLTIINHKTGGTNIFTRSLHPLQDNGKWTTWQMVATGDPELIAENNSINEAISALRQQIEDDSRRIEVTENSLLAGTTVRFHRIEESEAVVNKGVADTVKEIVYYKPANIFVAADSTGNYWDSWDGMEAYMISGNIRKGKVYLCKGEIYIYSTKNKLSPIIAEIMRRGTIQNDINELPFETIEGSYISRYGGTVVAYTIGCYSAPIPVSKGDVVMFKGTGGSSDGIPQVAAISLTDSEGSYYSPVVIRGEGAWYSLYYVENDGYVAFSWLKNNNGQSAYISSSELLKQLYDYTDTESSRLSAKLMDEINTANLTSDISQHLLGVSIEGKELEMIQGAYITYYGSLAPLASYSYSKPIFVKKGSLVATLSGGTADASAAIAITDAESSTSFTPVRLHTITENGAELLSYKVDSDCYVSVSGNRQWGFKMFVGTANVPGEDTSNALKEILKLTSEKKELDIIEGKFIWGASNGGTGILSTLASYSYAKPVFVKKGSIVTTISGGTAGASAAIAITDSETSTSFTVIQLHTKTESGAEELSFLTEKDCYVTVSGNRQWGLKMSVKSVDVPVDFSEANNTYNKWVYSFVDKCICIGDSVTEGHVYDYPRTKANGDVLKAQSYPTRLAKLTGWEIENAGFSGISAVDWWKNKLYNYQYTDYEIAIIELGYNGGLTDTLDVDVEPYETYAEYAETNTGCYCKIIEAIREMNPNIFIVLNISSLMSNGTTNSIVIKKIAERYQLPYIDLSENLYIDLNAEKFHGYTNENLSLNLVHFNALGYCAKAGFIYNELARILVDKGKELNDKHTIQE